MKKGFILVTILLMSSAAARAALNLQAEIKSPVCSERLFENLMKDAHIQDKSTGIACLSNDAAMRLVPKIESAQADGSISVSFVVVPAESKEYQRASSEYRRAVADPKVARTVEEMPIGRIGVLPPDLGSVKFDQAAQQFEQKFAHVCGCYGCARGCECAGNGSSAGCCYCY